MVELFSNAAPLVEDWDSPIQMHSNASEKMAHATDEKLRKRKITQFPYRLRTISLDGGKTILRLFEDLMIEVDHDNQECKVLHWETQLPLTSVQDIGRTLGRRFLQLHSRAEDNRLTEQDEAHWLEIIKLVDYQAFCIDRTPARYVEGIVKAVAPACTVEWHDGEEEVLAPHVFRYLNILNQGDRFGAWVKWGQDNKVQDIERLKLLTGDNDNGDVALEGRATH
jgi:hypothetical protein